MSTPELAPQSRTMPDPTGKTFEELFGRKSGRHTHPATHPAWLEFTDGDCHVCAGQG